MMAGYWARLGWMSAACFTVVEMGARAVAAVWAGAAVRRAERMEARRGAALLLCLRLGPAVLGVAAALGMCAPSYLLFERGGGEAVGGLCVVLGLIGAATVGVGAWRALRAWWRARRWMAGLLPAGGAEVWVVEEPGALVAMVGVVKPTLVVSRAMREALTDEEWAAAEAHERAHAKAWDNAKRLALAATPGAKTLTRAWARLAERAADDEAAGGNADRRLALAAALVKAARIGMAAAAPAVSALAAEREELAARVARLLDGPGEAKGARRTAAVLAAGAMAAALAMTQPAVLEAAHGVFERLLR